VKDQSSLAQINDLITPPICQHEIIRYPQCIDIAQTKPLNPLESFRIGDVHVIASGKGKKVIQGSSEQRFIAVSFDIAQIISTSALHLANELPGFQVG
jgi:hypothetical protein